MTAESNKQVEQDVRIVKVQQKVSSSFRNEAGDAAFWCIRGYLSTLRKQGLLLLSALESTCPRDAQRDFSKRVEKPKVDLSGEQVILCHTDGVLREWLPPLRGWGALDTRSAMAERAGNQNDRSAYEYGRPFLLLSKR